MKEIYLGADCAVTRHHFSLQIDGIEQQSFQLPNRESELREELTQIGRGGRVHLVVEGLYGFSALLVRIARDLGFVVWQVNPKALAHYRDLEGQRHKTDPVDAYLVARMVHLKMGGCRIALDPKPEESELRQLGRLHELLKIQRTEVGHRLRSKLLDLVPEIYQKTWQGPSPTSKQFLSVLERWPGFVGLSRARKSTIAEVLKGGPVSPEKRLVQAAALKEAARCLPDSRDIHAFEISLLVAQHQLLSRQIQETDERLEKQVRRHPIARKLTGMPGVGSFVAAVTVGELLPLARTSSEGKVATYAGLTPAARRSGQGGKDVFSRGSNKHALHACFMSAVASLRWSALDRAYYDKQRRQHQGHPKEHVVAALALARQRHKVMYKLMTTEAEYDSNVLIRSHMQRTGELAA